MDYRQYSKNILAVWIQKNRSYGMNISDVEFFNYVDNLSPSFLKFFGETLEIFDNDSKAKTALENYAKMVTKGKIPASRTELQGFQNVLIDTSKIIGFTGMAEIVSKAVKDTVIDIGESTQTALKVGSIALPIMIAIVAGILIFIRFKK